MADFKYYLKIFIGRLLFYCVRFILSVKILITDNGNDLCELADIYYFGIKDHFINQQKALEFYTRASEKGNARALYVLGYINETGKLVPKNIHRAINFYQRAIQKDNASAMCAMAYLYGGGHGVPKNSKKAIELYERTIQTNSEPTIYDASYNLATIYYVGDEVPVNEARAIELYKKAIPKVSHASIYLAEIYCSGREIPKT